MKVQTVHIKTVVGCHLNTQNLVSLWHFGEEELTMASSLAFLLCTCFHVQVLAFLLVVLVSTGSLLLFHQSSPETENKKYDDDDVAESAVQFEVFSSSFSGKSLDRDVNTAIDRDSVCYYRVPQRCFGKKGPINVSFHSSKRSVEACPCLCLFGETLKSAGRAQRRLGTIRKVKPLIF